MKANKKEEFATKDYLEKQFSIFFDRLKFYLDHKLEPFEEARRDFYSLKDSVLTTLDWLAGKYKKFEQEHDIISNRYPEINDKLEDHETRINKLERKSTN